MVNCACAELEKKKLVVFGLKHIKRTKLNHIDTD